MTELIEPLTLVGVAEYLVRLRCFLEFVFRFLVAGISVRMVLKCKFAIGFLDFLLCRFATYAEDFVVISLGHYPSPPVSSSFLGIVSGSFGESSPVETMTLEWRNTLSLSL